MLLSHNAREHSVRFDEPTCQLLFQGLLLCKGCARPPPSPPEATLSFLITIRYLVCRSRGHERAVFLNSNSGCYSMHACLMTSPPPRARLSRARSARRRFSLSLSQVALLGKASKSTTVKEIATMGANLVVASKSDTMQDCMAKMVARDIRHLPVVDEDEGQVCCVAVINGGG